MDYSILIILAAVAAVVAVVVSSSKKGSTPMQVSKQPWAFQWSPGMGSLPDLPNGGTTFDFPTAPSVGYMTRTPANKAVASVSIKGEVVTTGAPTFNFHTEANNVAGAPANFRLYFQRIGDNMTGAGEFQYYRWWKKEGVTLAPGEFQSVGDLTNPSEWSSVMGVSGDATPESVAAFREAAQNVGLIGITFGGGFFFGHGVFVDPGTGTATFKVNSFIES